MSIFLEGGPIWNAIQCFLPGMAHNGWSRVGPDASAVRAFALAKKP